MKSKFWRALCCDSAKSNWKMHSQSCTCLPLIFVFSSSTPSASFGFKSFSLVGSSILVQQLISCCASLLCIPSEVMFQWSRIGSQGSVLSLVAFLISLLAVLTALLTIPLDYACPGLEVTWWNSQLRDNLLNFSQLNCGLLSERAASACR